MKDDCSLEKLNAAWLSGRSSVASGRLILIADDSESDIFFLIRAITASKVKNPIHVVRSGAEVLNYFQALPPYNDPKKFPLPSVVFLDLKMPSPNGFEILSWVQEHPEFKGILFVAMSNFDSASAINKAYSAGAMTFLAKPINPADVRNIIDGFENYWDRVGSTDQPRPKKA